jgi:hypothetical protein
VCLEGITAVRDEKDDPPAGFEETNHFLDREPIILDVFEHLVAEDQVEGEEAKLPGG